MSVSNIAVSEVALPKTLIQLCIVDDSSASLTVLALAAGKRIFIWGMDLFVNGATDLRLKSNGTTDIFGTLGFAAQGNVILPKPDLCDPIRHLGFPYAQTNVGESLVVTNSGSVRLSGSIYVSQQ